MPSLHLGFTPSVPAGLADELAQLRTELEVPEAFGPAVLAAAEDAAGRSLTERVDRTDLALSTIDPEGAQDLDQAMALERDGSGFVVWYAIADVAAFVTAGDPIDVEARRRGQTLYAPDRRTPLHPPVLSEQAASLLADQVRPAHLWRIGLDAEGQLGQVSVERAMVRSREQLTYVEAQRRIDDGSASDGLALLKEIGQLREQVEVSRGGISLNLPEQQVVVEDGDWRLAFREQLPVEGWNAQISLLTGIAAADLMIESKMGVLRTLPPAEDRAVRKLRETARALSLPWPKGQSYPEFVRSLDPSRGDHVAMLNACTTLFRGAGYVAFDGEVPEHTEHAALATPYAHATAPLRRLGDRWVLEICAAASAGTPVPEWVSAGLEEIPSIMTSSDQRAKKYERSVIDLVEAHRLSGRVGSTFAAVVVDVDEDGDRGTVMVSEPAVEATVRGSELPLGQDVTVRLTVADPDNRKVEFALD